MRGCLTPIDSGTRAGNEPGWHNQYAEGALDSSRVAVCYHTYEAKAAISLDNTVTHRRFIGQVAHGGKQPQLRRKSGNESG